MAKEVVIHAGFHKSGTTALQNSFDHLRKILAENGVYYPLITGRAHHRAVWGLTGRVWGWRDHGGEKVSDAHWKSLVKKSRRSQDRVLISSEFLAEANVKEIERVKSDFAGERVKIVFTVRPFVKILASSYQQYLKYGIKIRYEEWLDEMFHKRESTRQTPSFWQRSAVAEVIERWVKVFGADAISIILADESKPTFIFNEISRMLGLKEGLLTPQEAGGNRSMSAEEVELLYQINSRFDRERGWEEYRVMFRQGYIDQLANHTEAATGSTRLLTPQWAIDEARKISERDIEALDRMGVKVIGDRQGFLSSTVAAGSNTQPETIDIDSVASFLLSYEFSMLKRFPIQVLGAEIRRRVRKAIRRKIKGVK